MTTTRPIHSLDDSVGDEYPYDLGEYARPVTTAVAAAGTWVNRGLVWTFGFNHEEAVECFQRAIDLDPDCALAHWGSAFALGPNYNKPWEFFAPDEATAVLERARDEARVAADCASGGTAVEQALTGALLARYPDGRPIEECTAWEVEYAAAMGQVYAAHGGDLDVARFYAEALMNLTAWQLWDQRTGEPAEGSRTLEAKAVLEAALAAPGGSQHPGLLHMYIHLMEMSPTPERSRPTRRLLPSGGR